MDDARRKLLERPNPVFGPGQMNPNADGLPVPHGIGPAPFQPSQPRGASPQRRIILPGCDFPPADAIPVDLISEQDIGPTVTVTLSTITVPDTYTMRIDGIGFGADDESGLRYLSWTLNVTPPNSGITPYINMPAAIGSIPQPSPVIVVLGSSYVLTLRATNNAPAIGATYHYFSRVKGWFYREYEVV
jgi:hypothetical protein